jgi:hypothetical protein
MKQYKVIAGAFPCPPQREINTFGTILNENYFLGDQLAEALNKGFIEEYMPPADIIPADGLGDTQPTDIAAIKKGAKK